MPVDGDADITGDAVARWAAMAARVLASPTGCWSGAALVPLSAGRGTIPPAFGTPGAVPQATNAARRSAGTARMRDLMGVCRFGFRAEIGGKQFGIVAQFQRVSAQNDFTLGEHVRSAGVPECHVNELLDNQG